MFEFYLFICITIIYIFTMIMCHVNVNIHYTKSTSNRFNIYIYFKKWVTLKFYKIVKSKLSNFLFEFTKTFKYKN